MEVGFMLWQGIGNGERDYFLPRPRADLQSFGQSPARNRDLATLGTMVLAELKVPIYSETDREFEAPGLVAVVEMKWVPSLVPLLASSMLTGWSGHSERATLPSLYAAMGVPKTERDPLGRWAPTGSDEYVRTYRALLRNLSGRLRETVCNGTLFAAGDEGDAMDDVIAYMELKGPVTERTKEVAVAFTTVMKEFYKEVAAASEMLLVSPPQSVALEKLTEDLAEEKREATHIIALSRRGSVLCLHRVPGCWRSQSMNFGSFELWYEESVPDHLYHSYCHDCWPREGPVAVAAIGRAACDGVSSSSSDSSV
jgi:hypothetical protein